MVRRGWERRAAAVVVGLALCGAACGAGSSTAEERPRGSAPSPRAAPPTSTVPSTTTTAVPTTTPLPTTTTTAVPDLPAGDDAVVTSVTDGDTIRVRTAAGADERVRLTGIDTPETRDPRRPVECFGREASAQTAALLPAGTAVRLEPDVERRDRYGRLLAYVWRADDAVHVNEALVAAGWAAPYRVPPNVRYADHFSRLGSLAREQGLGLWGACGGTDTPAGAPAGASTAAPAAAPAPAPPPPAGDCDTNYAGACVPPSTTDLDCADVGARRFTVVGGDPHGFDGDGDGVACE